MTINEHELVQIRKGDSVKPDQDSYCISYILYDLATSSNELLMHPENIFSYSLEYFPLK